PGMDFSVNWACPFSLHVGLAGELHFLACLIDVLAPNLGIQAEEWRLRQILAGRAKNLLGLTARFINGSRRLPCRPGWRGRCPAWLCLWCGAAGCLLLRRGYPLSQPQTRRH